MIRFLVFSFLIFTCSLWSQQGDASVNIIPKPQSVTLGHGSFVVNALTTIQAPDALKNEKEFLFDLMYPNGQNESYMADKNNSKAIHLELKNTIKGEEAYELSIAEEEIRISGKTAKGVFYGIQSLRQLLPSSVEKTGIGNAAIKLQAMEINDAPRFSYRGMHLDVGRHFQPAAFVKQYIDMIAMHKMNTFHWHLTEDQGWRIEIKKYPKLTEIGAWRKETLVGHFKKDDPNAQYDGKKHGGFYTQEEIREIVAYAKKRHVTIIPEIDLPGHSMAVLAAYPELGNTGKPVEVATTWGVFEHIYAPSEEAFTFLENVFTEIIDLFPGTYIHIGGDEAPKKEWEESAFAQEVIKREGLKDEHELQSYFIGRVEDFLNKHDRKIIGWDEVLEGGVKSSTSVMFWRSWLGYEDILKAAETKHPVIMTPVSHMYFDFYQVPEGRRNEEPLAIGGFTSVEKVYNFEPVPEEASEKAKEYIIGAQANIWTEYIKTTDYLEYMALPRMTALSEVVWTNKELKNWDDFLNRLSAFRDRYDELDLNYAKHTFK